MHDECSWYTKGPFHVLHSGSVWRPELFPVMCRLMSDVRASRMLRDQRSKITACCALWGCWLYRGRVKGCVLMSVILRTCGHHECFFVVLDFKCNYIQRCTVTFMISCSLHLYIVIILHLIQIIMHVCFSFFDRLSKCFHHVLNVTVWF